MRSRGQIRNEERVRRTAGGQRDGQHAQVRVVLVNTKPNCLSRMLRYLEIRNCRYGVVSTYDEARRLIRRKGCDLLVGPAPLPRGIVAALAGPLADDHASFFCAQPVEEGCWWLPVYLRGELCLGTPAFRPCEFVRVLDALVDEIRRAHAESATSRRIASALVLAAG